MADVNERLAALWTGLLDVGHVTERADFFEDGGTSIAAVHLAAGIQESFQITVDAVEIVSHPTFGELAALVRNRLAAPIVE